MPVHITAAHIESIRTQLPELPEQKRARFIEQYELSKYDSGVLTGQRSLADFFEAVAAGTTAPPKLAANWIISELTGALNKADLDIEQSPVSADDLAALLDKINDNTISGKIAKEVFDALWNEGGNVADIIRERGLEQITDTDSIAALVDKAIEDNPNQVAQYRAGKTQIIGFLVGQVMQASQGKANPQQVNAALRKKLDVS